MKRRKSAYAPPADARGASADRFRAVGPLGESGTLQEAEQLATGRRCVLRVLSPKLVVGDDALRDFEDVRGLRAKMNTVHVVELLDAGVDASSGAPWLAFDFLDGDSLADRITEMEDGRVRQVFEGRDIQNFLSTHR